MPSVFSYLHNLHGIGATSFAYRLADSHDNQITVAHCATLEQFVFGMIQDDLRIVRATARFRPGTGTTRIGSGSPSGGSSVGSSIASCSATRV